MIWGLVILLGILAVPLTIEYMRAPLSDKRLSEAPGKFALLSQGSTHYQWLGPERGPVAVCVHGLSTPSFVWGGMAKGLALMGFRVLVYDLYGRGFSETARGRQSADFFLTQLNDLLEHEDVNDPVTLLGYSMGGAIATHFAATSPARVKQLILLAPAGMQQIGGGKLKFVRDTPVIGDWFFMLSYPGILRSGIKAEAGLPSSVDGITALQERETDRRGYFPAILSSLRGVLRNTCEDQHRAIAAAGVPVLVVWAEEDDVVSLEGCAHLADWNEGARQEVVDGAGHGLTYTHTDDVLNAIRDSRS